MATIGERFIFLNVLWIVFVAGFSWTFIQNIKCPRLCKCYTNHTVICTGHHRQLYYIPPLPLNTTSLLFNQNSLRNLGEDVFKNLSHLHLTRLVLRRDNIHSVDRRAFESLPFLQGLDLSENKALRPSKLKNVFYGLRNNDLRELYLDKMNVFNLHVDHFKYLNKTRLKLISLDDNHLKIFFGFGLSLFTELREVSLGNNMITTVNLNRTFYQLETLVLKKNKLSSVPEFCESYEHKKSFVPNLQTLDISSNFLKAVKGGQFRVECLPKLKRLVLSNNAIKTLGSNLISHLPCLLYLSIENLHDHLTVIDLAINSTTLRHLTLANNFNFFMDNIDSQLFWHSPNLEVLDMTNINFAVTDGTKEKIFNLFKPLKNLKTLLLNRTSLSVFPSRLFSAMSSLTRLSLQNCKFSQTNMSVFTTARLKTLILDDNLISTINATSLPPYVDKIGLQNNPFLCNCDLVWFRDWIAQNSHRLLGWPKGYICKVPKEWERQPLSRFNLDYSHCHPPNPYVIAAIGVGIGVLIIMSVTVILYRKRWHIKYYLYLLRAQRRGYESLGGEDFLYDVFVAYNSKDRVWIISEMIPRLEIKENMRLCLHERDFEAGKLIVDNITDNIHKSRKILIVLSNNFVQSHWCRFEIMLAQSLNVERDAVIIVVLEEILTKNMTKSLHLLLTTTTYIEWINEDSSKKLFWDRLVLAFR